MNIAEKIRYCIDFKEFLIKKCCFLQFFTKKMLKKMAPLSFQRCLSRWKCQEMAPGHVSVQKKSWKVIWMLEFKMAPFFSYYCLFFSKKTAKIMHRFMKNGAIYEVRCYWVLYQLFYIFFKIKSTQKYNFDAHYMVSEKKAAFLHFWWLFGVL